MSAAVNWLQSSPVWAMRVKVVKLTANAQGLTNRAFLHPDDYAKLRASSAARDEAREEPLLVDVGGYVYACQSDPKLERGSLGLSVMQRLTCALEPGDDISIGPISRAGFAKVETALVEYDLPSAATPVDKPMRPNNPVTRLFEQCNAELVAAIQGSLTGLVVAEGFRFCVQVPVGQSRLYATCRISETTPLRQGIWTESTVCILGQPPSIIYPSCDNKHTGTQRTDTHTASNSSNGSGTNGSNGSVRAGASNVTDSKYPLPPASTPVSAPVSSTTASSASQSGAKSDDAAPAQETRRKIASTEEFVSSLTPAQLQRVLQVCDLMPTVTPRLAWYTLRQHTVALSVADAYEFLKKPENKVRAMEGHTAELFGPQQNHQPTDKSA